MRKAKPLENGDKVAIVSLSAGTLGEKNCQHELDLACKRLTEFGLVYEFMPNALRGVKYLHDHPEARAQDLIDAWLDDSIKGIICAHGGDDTYRLLPYLMENKPANKKSS